MSKGKKKEKKSPTAPKRAMTAFLYYTKDRREILKKEKPDLDHKQIISTMGTEWNKLKDGEKKKYLDLASEDRKRYEKEKAAYTAKMSGEKGKKKQKS